MNVAEFTFIQWPVKGGWLKNKFYLEMMSVTARVWNFKRRVSRDKYEWTPEDVDFDAWLSKGKPKATVIGEAAMWAMEQGLIDGDDH